MTILALDIGGTKMAAGRINPDTGAVTETRTVPVPARGVWDACRQLLLDVAGDETVERIGIASAGPVDMANGVAAPINIPEWRTGFNIVSSVRELFGLEPVRVDTEQGPVMIDPIRFAIDGVCMALAEQRYGAARGVPDALVMTVSTGIGGGILVGGFTAVGRTGNCGHIGHIQVSGFDEKCRCGGRGCVEAVASGPATVRWAQRQGWEGETAEQLAKDANAGENIAQMAMNRAGTALGQAIASAAALLDIDLVVVGGGFAQSGDALWGPMREAVTRQSGLGFLAGLRVVPSPLKSTATLVGAGVLVS